MFSRKPDCFTLNHHLVAGHQYLLPIRCLSILEHGGTLLASTRVRHGNSLQALNAFGSWGCQLDCTISSYSNWDHQTGECG